MNPSTPAQTGNTVTQEVDPSDPRSIASHLEKQDEAAFAWLLGLEFTHDFEAETAKQTVVSALRLASHHAQLIGVLREAREVLDEAISGFISGSGPDMRWSKGRDELLDRIDAALASAEEVK